MDIQLVQIIPICKKAVENILDLLSLVEDNKREFELIYSANRLNKFLLLKGGGGEKIYVHRYQAICNCKNNKPNS